MEEKTIDYPAVAERHICRIANEWWATITNDPSIELEDLRQELRWRYWNYCKEHDRVPAPNTIRNWARKAMRGFGYCGSDHDDFLREEPQIILAGDILAVTKTTGLNITDEELLDGMAFHGTSCIARSSRRWFDNEENNES